VVCPLLEIRLRTPEHHFSDCRQTAFMFLIGYVKSQVVQVVRFKTLTMTCTSLEIFIISELTVFRVNFRLDSRPEVEAVSENRRALIGK